MNTLLAKLWKFLRLPKALQLAIMRLMQDEFLVGATGLVFNNKGEVLLFKHTYRQREWSLPGGYVKGKEHPSEGLEREIEEESGFIVSIDKELKLRTDRETSRLDICYIGEFMGGEFKKSAEVSEYGFFSFETLPTISKNQLFLIQEAMSIKNKDEDIHSYLYSGFSKSNRAPASHSLR